MKLKEANERLCNLETVVLELENENYSLDEFQNQTYYNINLSFYLLCIVNKLVLLQI